MTDTSVFENVEFLPSSTARQRYDGLVGLDSLKRRLSTEGALLVQPSLLETWSERVHPGKVVGVVDDLSSRIPLFVFGGDVGTGKTELAETFGTALASELKIRIELYRLSLNARGSGRVGEMTQLISTAFRELEARFAAQVGAPKPSAAGVLVIDEADALAQSREQAQMHHEDRAGVNALIRSISTIATKKLPILVVMCTNRTESLDPAVLRRAAAVVKFQRPNDEQRMTVLAKGLDGTGITTAEIDRLVELTGPTADRPYGYTYSDIRSRLLPAAAIDAYPTSPITAKRIEELLLENPPTVPFQHA